VKKQRTYQSTICWARPLSGSWLVLFILSIVLFDLTGCGKKEEAKPEVKPAEVFVVKIEPRDTPVTVEYVAQTQSSQQVEIRPRVNGFLDKRVYTEGSIVKG
jgi:multidrug efflux pump subunit AcrA (membrane-fusion protein)